MILIIDDDPNDRRFISLALREAGLKSELVEAEDGREALELAARRPKLIFLDLQMPEMDGYEIARRLRAERFLRATPILAFASSDEPAVVERAYAAGVSGFLKKPGDFRTLIDHVVVAARYWLDVNRPRPR